MPVLGRERVPVGIVKVEDMTIVPVPRVAVIVVAAGSGTRLGGGGPKALVGLDAHTILRHALRGGGGRRTP